MVVADRRFSVIPTILLCRSPDRSASSSFLNFSQFFPALQWHFSRRQADLPSAGTMRILMRSDEMAVYPQYQRDGLAGALAIHLCLYCAVGGCFAFGLYELLQPTRFVN